MKALFYFKSQKEMEDTLNKLKSIGGYGDYNVVLNGNVITVNLKEDYVYIPPPVSLSSVFGGLANDVQTILDVLLTTDAKKIEAQKS